MKYVVFLGDGMADFPTEMLGGKTPLELANKPNIDRLAKTGTMGLAKTVDDSLKPGSDVANLSVLGYDPLQYYTGRSPLEALSIGVNLADSDVTFRANVVTVSDEADFEDKTMIDYSAGEISTEESTALIAYLQEHLVVPDFKLYAGVSYRHLLVWNGGTTDVELIPPHDITNRPVKDYLPKGEKSGILFDIMKKSHELLKDHPVNLARIKAGKNPANTLWIWGEGTRPALDLFQDKFGISGTMISAVDLLKGIANGTGMDSIDVAGATGNIETNFDGKAKAAIDALAGGTDFVYIHVEAPDECGHHAQADLKVKAIEIIDEKIVAPVMAYLEESCEDYKVLICPDHPTPLDLMTHTKDPIPFVMYRKGQTDGKGLAYTEANAKATGVYVEKGCNLMNLLLEQ